MGKFGILKEKILKYMTESYSKEENGNMKDLLKKIKSNKDFKDVYMFYENFENMYIEDDDIRNLYITESESILRKKMKLIEKFQSEIEEILSDVEIVSENSTYVLLDTLIENNNLTNVHIKVGNKVELNKFLSLPKDNISENTTNSCNENMLHQVLIDNFNNKYMDFLNEDEINLFNEIINLSESDLQNKFVELKDETILKLDSHITNDSSLNERLNSVKEKILNEYSEPNRINFLKIKDLNNSL